MSQPPPPPHLTYQSNTYLTLSSLNPSALPSLTTTTSSPTDSDSDSPTHSHQSSSSSSFDLRSSLQYIGPVGSLRDSHIFSLPVPTTNPPQEEVERVKEWLEKEVKGVSNVEVMQPKKRAGRRFEC